MVGAGFIGLEMAENLHAQGAKVSIVEMGNQVMAPIDFDGFARASTPDGQRSEPVFGTSRSFFRTGKGKD